MRGAAIAVATGVTTLVAMAAGAGPAHDAAAVSPATDARCLGCHRIEPALSHPVGVLPSMQVPADLPLIGGRLACVTCHDVLSSGGSGAMVACGTCHDTRQHGRADIHAMATTRAHLASGPRPAAGDGALRGLLGPDAESRRCLGCHDGAVASGVGERYGRGGPASFDRVTSRHPIGGEQRPRGPGDNLVHANGIDPRIRLFDGRVGCGSCHSPYAREHALLVMSNVRSALCLACHGM